MKKSTKILIITLFLCFNQFLVNGETIIRPPQYLIDASIRPVERNIGKLNISIDPRMELLTAVQLLANYPMINRDLPYSQEVINHFEAFSTHEAVLITNRLLQNHGFSFDAPVAFMLHLSQLPELKEKIKFSDYVAGRSGRGDNLKQYRKALQQFAEISNFETFWNSKIPFYNQILDLTIVGMNDFVEDFNLVAVLENYLNETKEKGYSIIIAPSFRGGYAKLPEANSRNVYAILGANNMKDDTPYMVAPNMILLALHEFGHTFVNPLTSKHLDRVNSFSELFEPIKEQMTRMAYPEWELCVNEHIIRAICIRLIRLHLETELSKLLLDFQIETQASKFFLENELNQGFVYIEPLIEKLKEFEYQRDKYNITFTEFFPQLLDVFEGLLSNKID